MQRIPPDKLNCLKGDSLIYSKPNNICGTFIDFKVFGSQTRNGPYDLLGTITDFNEFAFDIEFISIISFVPISFCIDSVHI